MHKLWTFSASTCLQIIINLFANTKLNAIILEIFGVCVCHNKNNTIGEPLVFYA